MSKKLNGIRQDIKEKEQEKEKYDRQLKQVMNREKKKRQIQSRGEKKDNAQTYRTRSNLKKFY